VQIKKKSAANLNAMPKTLKKRAEELPKKKQAAKKPSACKTTPQVKVPPEFTMKQVKEIVALIKDAGNFTSFAYKTDEFEIEIAVGSPTALSSTNTTPLVPSVNVASVSASSLTVAAAGPAISDSERLVTSPMIGTFYRRPSPNSAPFVEVGDQVTPDTDVCIVEVMKLLNTIPAGCKGTVSQILVEDGATIESGQALMVIKVS
jgi:acetyl-CoA carboxylase biotin carboxyl carrier protein